MPKPMISESRRHPRISIIWIAEWVAGKCRGTSQLLNISGGGAFLRIKSTFLEPGQRITLRIWTAMTAGRDTSGVVRWVDADRNGVGIEFDVVDPAIHGFILAHRGAL